MAKKELIDPHELMALLRREAELVVAANGKFESVDNVPFFLDEIDHYLDKIKKYEGKEDTNC